MTETEFAILFSTTEPIDIGQNPVYAKIVLNPAVPATLTDYVIQDISPYLASENGIIVSLAHNKALEALLAMLDPTSKPTIDYAGYISKLKLVLPNALKPETLARFGLEESKKPAGGAKFAKMGLVLQYTTTDSPSAT